MYDDSDELKALKAKEQELRETLARLQTRRNRVTAPASVRQTNIDYNDTWDAIEANRAAQTELRRKEIATKALTEAGGMGWLAKRLAGARNYSYEAQMGDYSIGSIDRARQDVADVTAVYEALGLDPNEAVISLPGQGWIAKPTLAEITEQRERLNANTALNDGPRARAHAALDAQLEAIGETVTA